MPKKKPEPEAPQGQMRLEYEPLSELRRAPRNPKLHRLDLLEASFKRFGYTQPLLKDERTGLLVAGHGRLDELEVMRATGAPPPDRIVVGEDGEWLVPVIRGVAFKDDREAEAYLLADNRVSELGGWDDAGVTAILNDLTRSSQEGEDLLAGIGYETQDLARIEAELYPPMEKEVRLPPEERKEIFDAATIKQVVFLYPSDEYPQVLERLHRVMNKHQLTDNSQVLLALLDLFDYHQENASSSGDPTGD